MRVLERRYKGRPSWKRACKGAVFAVQDLNRPEGPALHLHMGNRILASMHQGQDRTVRLDDGHFWYIKLRSWTRLEGGVQPDLERYHSPRCPCHSTAERGSLLFAIQAERAQRELSR